MRNIRPSGPTVEFRVSFKRRRDSRRIRPDLCRVPRIARLLALAHKLDAAIRAGEIRNWADIATLGSITRARASQIAGLLNLCPSIQEALLLMPPTTSGRDQITERSIRRISNERSWRRQRLLWRQLLHYEEHK